ncbi:MAG: hypothetical protein GF311_16430 [Candidatus Lokiarchaeota archaeon]|nr:hypothetical protein [Candidatus Lokiarchaeota archaeon]
MQNQAMPTEKAVKKYIKGIKNEQFYIYDNKSLLRSIIVKGKDPEKYEQFLINYNKSSWKFTKAHFQKYGINLENYY